MLNIYLDNSGSMFEMGKNSALVYVAKSIQDYCEFYSIDTIFYDLGGNKIDDLINIKFDNNKINLTNISANSILVSDGLFDLDNKENIFDISLAVGIDADISNLKKISKKYFYSDNILSALEYIIYKINLLENSTNIQEEEEDEW